MCCLIKWCAKTVDMVQDLRRKKCGPKYWQRRQIFTNRFHKPVWYHIRGRPEMMSSFGGRGVSQNIMYFLKDWRSIGISYFFSKKSQHFIKAGEEKRLCTAFVDFIAGHLTLPWRGMQKFTEMLFKETSHPIDNSFYGRLLLLCMSYCYLDINVQ